MSYRRYEFQPSVGEIFAAAFVVALPIVLWILT
jgi:hypothetical protein